MERNVFRINARTPRIAPKKLHKVSHQFSCGLRPCKIVRIVKILPTMLGQNLVPRFCKERNVFRINARTPRTASKKLHKVFHQSIFAPLVLDIL